MTENKASTDEITEIELPSSIQQIAWTREIAAPLGEVSLEVFTQFVGNGSEIQIQLKDESGKKYDKLKTKIAGNYFRKSFQVPEKARDALYAQVKLSKHKLKGDSPPLYILPPIELENPQWSQKEARRGDILTIKADVKGAPDDSEAEFQIWEHDDDGAHDLITKFPAIVKNEKVESEWEFQYFEDTDDIPTDEEVDKGYQPPEYFFRVDYHGVYTDSDILEFKDFVEIELKDHDDKPIGGEHFKIILPDGSEKEGDLDDNGYAKVEDVPPGKYKIVFDEHDDVDLSDE